MINFLPNKPAVITFLICFALLHILAANASAALTPLASPPLGERWFSISMNGEKVGFAHTNMTATPEGFRIASEGSAKMLVLGFSREASATERYELNHDLTLRSFVVEQTIDKSPLNISGTVTGRNIKIKVTTKSGSSEKTLKAKGAVYPPPVVNIIPLVKGFSPGKKYTLQMLDVESVKIKEVTIKGIAEEIRNGTKTVHMQNDLYTFVDNDIWLDYSGNTMEESVRDGLIVTRTEDPVTAARSLLQDAVSKKDLVFDFSLVRINRDIPDPATLRKLVLELSGYPDTLPVPEGPGQSATRKKPGTIRLVLTAPLRQSDKTVLSEAEKLRYLSTTPRINADNPEIISRKREILAASGSIEQSVTLLTRWVADTLDDTVTDSHSALESLKLRKGNCVSHARLYITMARAAGIPSRMVSGLVYLKGEGFLYHSWAESHLDGWVAVDPTFGQNPADITHIRLIEGDEPEDMAPLAGIVGRIRAGNIEITR
jgi:transglutaminase-like putative cysteine protease